MVEQWMDGEERPAAALRRRYDHSERSEPEGVMPPFRYKGLESNFAFPEEGPSGKCGQMKWGGAPLRFPKRTRGLPPRKAEL